MSNTIISTLSFDMDIDIIFQFGVIILAIFAFYAAIFYTIGLVQDIKQDISEIKNKQSKNKQQ